jgi:hypothetical protein
MFVLFLIPVSVMFEVIYELRQFSATVEESIETQLSLARSAQLTLNNTQAIIIASSKSNLASTEERQKQVQQILDAIHAKSEVYSPLEKYFKPSKPTPLLSP